MTNRTDHNTRFERITAGIIEQLEQGTAPWLKGWTKTANASPRMPYNAATMREYSGINVLLLWGTALEEGYGPGGWLTFRQAKELGGSVRRGEHGTTVFYASTYTKERDDGSEETYGFLKAYTTFHQSQCDGLPDRMQPQPLPQRPEHERHAAADRFIAASGATVRHIENHNPTYFPEADYIALPLASQYQHVERYYSSALHELTHWTGHASRLARDFSRYHHDYHAWAAEELTAELGSAFLCAHLGIEAHLHHAEQIGCIVRLMKEYNRAIFTAASKASAAAEYLRARAEPQAQAIAAE